MALVAALLTTLSAQEGPSIWTGIYTVEQANRGEPLYNQECAECHGPAMEGDEMAPALADDTFRYNWNGLTVGDLFERIRVSMPEGQPSSVPRGDKAAILAYILLRNDYPAGDTELRARTEWLMPIMFEAIRP